MSNDYLVETSIWIKGEFGTPLERDKVKNIEQSARVYASRYIQMELNRAILLTLAETYLLIHNEISLTEALLLVARKFSFHKRKLITVINMIAKLLEQDQMISNDPKETKFQIRKYIRAMNRRLKRGMSQCINDQTGCPLAHVGLSLTNDELAQLAKFQQFISRFKLENDAPSCRLHEFLDNHREIIETFVSHEVKGSSVHRNNRGFSERWEDFEKLLAGTLRVKCFHSCAKLGDTVISLEQPGDLTLLTSDRAFRSLCSLQRKDVRFLEEV